MTMKLDGKTENMLKLLAASLNPEKPDAEKNAEPDSEKKPDDLRQTTKDLDQPMDATASFTDWSQWPDIRKELEVQAVLPLTGDVIAKSCPDDSIQMDMLKRSAANLRSFHRLMRAQAAFLKLLNENGIPVVILKGGAAAQYYDRPAMRQYGDIDALVLPDSFEKTFYLLRENGYRNVAELDAPYQRHIGFDSPEGVKIELHRFFSSSENEEQNQLFDGWLYGQFSHIQTVSVDGYSVPVLTDMENGLILLGHINQHLSSGLGFRQIIDWMFYVKRCLDDDAWNSGFGEKARRIGMEKLARVVTKMCKKYLGLSPSVTWCDTAEDDLTDEFLEYLLAHGNFGRKIAKDTRATVSVTHAFTSPKRAFQYLTKAGTVHMTEAGLKPRKSVAWLYQIGHLISKTLQRKGDVHVAKEMQTGKREADFLKRLEVTRM